MSTLYKKIAQEAAKKSGIFIKRSLGRVKKISYKGRINLVTDIDKKAEEIAIKTIKTAFPGHSVLSEERRPEEHCSAYRWIIDPLDGTTNFVHSFPFFCVSIALEKEGKPVLGVVYDPMRDEMFCAEEKKGAYLNGKKIRVTRAKRLSEGFLATGFSYGLNEARDKNINNFIRFLKRARAVRRAGSAALDMCYVACGRFDGFWERDLNPWDCAAGYTIVKEAGGVISRFDGSKWSYYDKEVLATNGVIHKAMVKVLSKKRTR